MSQGQSSVNEKTQGGKGWGRETAGVSREQCSEEGHTEAGGSSGPEAGHHWPAAAVLKTTTTAEAAEATRKKHAMTHKIHKHYKVLGPSCLALRLSQ